MDPCPGFGGSNISIVSWSFCNCPISPDSPFSPNSTYPFAITKADEVKLSPNTARPTTLVLFECIFSANRLNTLITVVLSCISMPLASVITVK